MKLFPALLVLFVVGTAGAATALTYNRSGDPTSDAVSRICTLAGYTIYCN